MSQTDEEKLRIEQTLTEARPSPERTFPKPNETDSRPGFITNERGTSWSGMIRGKDISENGGTTYGDTDIDLSNPDTRARVDRAKEPLPEKGFYDKSFAEQAILLNQFTQRIHQDDVIGSYFPEVSKVQAEQGKILSEAMSRVLSDVARDAIQDLRQSQIAQNTANWSRRDEKGIVEDSAVIQIEETNKDTSLAVLQIQREASYGVLDQETAERIEKDARSGVDNLTETDIERRVVGALLHAATEATLTAEEKTKLAELQAEEDRLWDDKHANQTDFADAIRDGNPDCSEYASLSAVSLSESGINNMRVMGHVLHDRSFSNVGAHAYNVILDESGENVIGVFEGTATSGAFKQVMNGVSLEDFENGATLITFNAASGWSTYGTGAPANGQGLMDYVDDPDNPGEKTFVTNIIERRDTNAMAEAKMDYAQSLSPEVVADQIIGLYEQYGDAIKIQSWVNNVRDGGFINPEGSPALAQAAQILHDYEGEMPPPMELRERIIGIVENAQERALTNDNYDLAITPEDLHEFDRPASASLAADIKEALDKIGDISPEAFAKLSADKPWLAQAKQLSDQIGDVQYGYAGDGKSAFDYASEGDPSYLDKYSQMASIVRDQDITSEDLKELENFKTGQDATIGIQATLSLGNPT